MPDDIYPIMFQGQPCTEIYTKDMLESRKISTNLTGSRSNQRMSTGGELFLVLWKMIVESVIVTLKVLG